jgi:hypothetical protein
MDAPQLLQKKSWLVASLAAWFLVLVGFFGGSTILAADFAVDKGSNMFSFTAGFINAGGELYENSKGNSSTIILVMPSWAHFVQSNLGFGGDLLLMHQTQGESGITTLGVGPKAVYFFGREESKIYPFLTLGVYYISNTQEYGSFDFTVSGTRLKFGGGTNFLVSPHLGILMEVSYNLDNLKAENAKESQSGNMLIVSIGLAGFSF